MVNLVFGILGFVRIFLKYSWIVCTEYIEFTDAFVLGFLTWLISTAELPISSEVGIVLGIVIGIGFLLLFNTRVGWWIATPIFSYMWASIMGWLADELLHVSPLWHWIVVGGSFAYFIWLHYYAKWRKWSKESIAAEEAAAKAQQTARENEEYEQAQRRMDALSKEMAQMMAEHERQRTQE